MTIDDLKMLEQKAGAAPWRFDGQEITDSRSEVLLIQDFDECAGSYETGSWREYSSRFGPAEFAVVMRNLAPEILALVEAVREDILDEGGEPCDCAHPVCAAWQALMAKMESMGRSDDSR